MNMPWPSMDRIPLLAIAGSVVALSVSACALNPAVANAQDADSEDGGVPGQDAPGNDAIACDCAAGDAHAEPDSPEEPATPVIATGSYLLRFTTVTLDGSSWHPPLSTDATMRLDLRAANGLYEAAFTPVWGHPSILQVQVLPDRIVLTGAAEVGKARCSAVMETWSEIVVPITPSGEPAGTFTASGIGGRSMVNSQSGEPATMTGNGLTHIDDGEPVPQAKWIPRPAGLRLPWSVLELDWSEGVDEAGFDQRQRLQYTDGNSKTGLALGWTLKQVGAGNAPWTGLWHARGVSSDWDLPYPGTVEYQIDPGVVDLAGNSAAAFVLSAPVANLGPAQAVFDFSDGAPVLGRWGDTKILTGADASLCEASSCLQLGPLDMTSAETWSHGVAGRVALGGMKHIVVRYRVITDAQGGWGHTVGFMIASRGPAESTMVMNPPPLAGDGGTSNWTDMVLEVPAATNADEAGYAITPSREYMDGTDGAMGCGVDSFPYWHTVTVLVQSVKAVP
ncbi:MAG: hypothetical protein HY898_17730 [Deltaproteobacteria bacterium]|nr:hypothetical protein [Deltaproteobacteria bacterium]